MKIKGLLCIILIVTSCYTYGQVYNIKNFGAVGDNRTLNTGFIQKAIDAAFSKGGGRVLVPAGIFLTGTIRLKNNVDLHLDKDAVLLGSSYLSDYERNNRWYAIVLAEKQNNIAITGSGTIDGQGKEVVKNVIKLIENKAIADPLNKNRPGEYFRPQLIEITNCTKILIKNVTLKNAACWVQSYIECNNLTIDSIHVESTTYWNNDGIDIIDCKNAEVKNANINAADDGICLKSSNPELTCENINISNCKVRSSASGIKFGTGSVGGFKKINIDNIYVYDTYRTAIALEMVDGGILEDVSISNITARNSGGALFIRLGQRNKKLKPGIIRRIYIKGMNVEVPNSKPDAGYDIEGPPGEDIHPHNLLPSSIAGLPGYPVQDVTLENIIITHGGGANKSKAFVSLDSLEKVPERASDYPEYSMFGELPSWGIYTRHANDIRLKNVVLKYTEQDFRPALVFDDVNQLTITDLEIPTVKVSPTIVLRQVSNESLKKIKMPVNKKSAIIRK